MKKLMIVLLGLPLFVQAQDSLSIKKLDDVIIFSGKFPERRKNIVQKIDVISATRIAQLNSQNTGDLLVNNGNVFVQKSQQGGSSPVIRGFEASRVLLIIDGIRMNNAIYRAGHLQNIITVDQNMLEQVEVLYGPASTLYGSDALGGAVHLRTKNPALSNTGKTKFTGSAFARYSSANNEQTVHGDVSISGKRWGALTSINWSDFDDMRMGDNYPDKYPNFGRRTEYIAFINGVDSIVRNEDDRVQKFSGYRQWDLTQKLLRKGDKVTHLINLQFSNSSNVPRYDRLQDRRNGVLRFAEWYYGPQLRTLAAYEMTSTKVLGFDEFRAGINYQYIEESRHQREYRRYDRLDNRFEEVQVWGAVAEGRRLWGAHELVAGADAQLNDVQSSAFRQNIRTGAVVPLDSRYPNGNNHMNNFGAFAQHTYKFGAGRWVLNDGLRVQQVHLRSTITDNSFFRFPFNRIEQNNTAVTGNIGVAFMPKDGHRISFGLSSAFRAPNVDDAARIFESNTASRQLIVPNPNIRPEYTYNADLGVTTTVVNKLRLELNGFYTLFRNAIALAPDQLNGQDSVSYNGATVKVFSNQNAAKAYLYGGTATVTYIIGKGWQAASAITYTFGRLQRSGVAVPLDHIPPVYGRTALQYTGSKLDLELYSLYNGWKRIEDYNPSGEDNAQYATPDGTPAWVTFNIKAGYKLNKVLLLQGGVENIADRNYRYFASGFSAPGRNFILSLRATF